MWRNTEQGYGWASILIHWIMAVAIIGLFALGVYMTGLTYYDTWYKLGPYIHEGVGVIVGALLVLRIIWRVSNPHPRFEPNMQAWERFAASATHYALYALLLVVIVSGYLITTAKGNGVNVFDLFEIPATVQGIERLEDYAGKVHWYVALLIMALATMHTLAALKHHFINKDKTLVRMLTPKASRD